MNEASTASDDLCKRSINKQQIEAGSAAREWRIRPTVVMLIANVETSVPKQKQGKGNGT